MVTEPCEMLVDKIREHNTITMCPYCKKLFDIHVGMVFLEGKETESPPRDTHEYFVEVMNPRANEGT